MRDESKARNEELFRNVNEQIEMLSQTVEREDPVMEYLCECDRPDCYEKVKATRAEYETVRTEPTHFIVSVGHQDPSVERVLASNDRFVIVEKQGDAARDAKETDPRN
ncbi:MAG: hypothetical protein E6F98_02240 [Actinobacteria bacterium]|jgi:hypothetical protein|nr:MAG: hypothetical protein E6F98_02240 [Actinomycetota bacterium]